MTVCKTCLSLAEVTAAPTMLKKILNFEQLSIHFNNILKFIDVSPLLLFKGNKLHVLKLDIMFKASMMLTSSANT